MKIKVELILNYDEEGNYFDAGKIKELLKTLDKYFASEDGRGMNLPDYQTILPTYEYDMREMKK